MDTPPSISAEGLLPADCRLIAELSGAGRNRVLQVEWNGSPFVLRTGTGVAAEVALLARVRAPGLIQPVRWGQAPSGEAYLLRPFADGRPFDEAAAEAPAEQVARWVVDLLATLGSLHRAGFVHRDVKAGNVIVGPAEVSLVDLDLVAAVGTGGGAGTPLHIAPEVLTGGRFAPSSDLFSVGVMLALAFCGPARPDFHERFPRMSFWEAAGLTDRALPAVLAPLTRALVRRHPPHRPVSAAAAEHLIPDVERRVLPERKLPLLVGRDGELADLLTAAGPGRVVLVSVEHEDDRTALLEALGVEVHARGLDVRRVVWAGAEDGANEPTAVEADVSAGSGDDSAGSGDDSGQAASSAVWDVLLSRGVARPGVIALMNPEQARGLRALCARRLRPAELARLHEHEWSGLHVDVLTSHLDALSAGVAPHVAADLARSLHTLSGGRLAAVNRLLDDAVEAGVMAPAGDAYTLLLDAWPERPGGGLEGPGLERLTEPARRLLAAWTLLGEHATASRAAQVARTSAAESLEGQLQLRADHVLREGPGGVLEVDGTWRASVVEALAGDARRALHERCAQVLEADGGDAFEVAWHRARVAGSDESWDELLAVVDRERLGGRAARARRLWNRLRQRAGEHEPSATAVERLEVLGVRLEVAQGHAARALAESEARYGTGLDGASHAVLVAAALAAEQAGVRDQARAFYERAQQLAPSESAACWSIMGLAYADLLDGKVREVLERIGRRPDPGDPDEAAVALLQLKGVACTRSDRFDEAQRYFAAALARAEACGDTAGIARAEVNRAFLCRRQGRLTEAHSALEHAASISRRSGSIPNRARVLNNLGVLQRDLGDLRRARELLAQSWSLRRRVGDVHGAATSLANLALVSLDEGAGATALRCLEEAEELLTQGEYHDVRSFVSLQRVGALALVGRAAEARELCDGELAAPARRTHAALAARVDALVRLAAGDAVAAVGRAREGHAAAVQQADVAERFRAAALWAALADDDRESHAALREAAQLLEGVSLRQVEVAWRTRAPEDEVDADQLGRWLDAFEAGGRTDLVYAVAAERAQVLDALGDDPGRRAMAARAGAATESLIEGLPKGCEEDVMNRIARLAGARATGREGLGLDWFLECSRRMAADTDLEGLLGTIVDAAREIAGARHGLLVLLDDDSLAVEVARGLDHQTMPTEEIRFSRTLVHRAIDSGEPLLITDASADERFRGTGSISSLHLRSVLCVPFRMSDGARGALYLDNDLQTGAFDEVDASRVASLTDQAAIAITNLRHREQIEGLNRRLADRVEFQEEELQHTRRLLARQGEVAPVAGLVGEAEAMRVVHRLVDRLAPTDLPVLVSGASGTGKDLVARALHERSARAAGPLVVENVAALPTQLLESEMFGHVRGAFTGADRDRPGLFAEADGGTFVLDELGEMPLELQAKLLRVLESGEYRPVGSRRTLRANVRIVAATNRDLMELVQERRFREDLYYRLNAAEIRMPPLSDRIEDVPLLARHFLDRLNAKHGTAKTLAEDVLVALVRRPWPGNVRELANEVARLYFLSSDVIDEVGIVRRPASSGAQPELRAASLKLEDVERAAIERALEATGGRKDQAARVLGISRAGLYAKLKRLGPAQ